MDRDANRGLYQKYIVKRADGSHRRGQKHERCKYFVLDLIHDKFAAPALLAYALACESTYPELSRDLKHIVKTMGGV